MKAHYNIIIRSLVIMNSILLFGTFTELTSNVLAADNGDRQVNQRQIPVNPLSPDEKVTPAAPPEQDVSESQAESKPLKNNKSTNSTPHSVAQQGKNKEESLHQLKDSLLKKKKRSVDQQTPNISEWHPLPVVLGNKPLEVETTLIGESIAYLSGNIIFGTRM